MAIFLRPLNRRFAISALFQQQRHDPRIRVIGRYRKNQRRRAADVFRIHIGAGFYQRLDRIVVRHPGRDLQRRQMPEKDRTVLHDLKRIAGLDVYFRAMLQQQLHHLRVTIAVPRSLNQWRDAAAVDRIHHGAFGQ